MDQYKRKNRYKENAMPNVCLGRLDAVAQHGMDLYYGENFHD